MRETEGTPSEIDLSNEFLELTESQFNDRLDQIAREVGSSSITIKVPVKALSTNVFETRLKRFLTILRPGQKRQAVVIASEQDYETFKEKFPGVEWQIADQK